MRRTTPCFETLDIQLLFYTNTNKLRHEFNRYKVAWLLSVINYFVKNSNWILAKMLRQRFHLIFQSLSCVDYHMISNVNVIIGERHHLGLVGVRHPTFDWIDRHKGGLVQKVTICRFTVLKKHSFDRDNTPA